MPSLMQVERAEQHLKESRRTLAGFDNDSQAQKASKMVLNSFEDSLKLFVNSIKYQDPMSPVDTTEMAKQMFQLSQALGMHSMNERLEQQVDMMRTSQVLNTSNLIGKTIEVKTDHFSLNEQKEIDISYDIPRGVAKAKIEISDQKGSVVFEKEITPKAGQRDIESGRKNIIWSGEINTAHGRTINSGNPLNKGEYKIRVTPFDIRGGKIVDPLTDETAEIPITIKAKLTGSDFSQKLPKLMIGDTRLPLSAIVSIQEEVEREDKTIKQQVEDIQRGLNELEEADSTQIRTSLKEMAQERKEAERAAQKLEKHIKRLSQDQFNDLKQQLEQRLTRAQ